MGPLEEAAPEGWLTQPENTWDSGNGYWSTPMQLSDDESCYLYKAVFPLAGPLEWVAR